MADHSKITKHFCLFNVRKIKIIIPESNSQVFITTSQNSNEENLACLMF